jgi:serine/threonine protein kinase
MLSAHSHLQLLNIAHRDIKPENIILFDKEDLLFKICDVYIYIYINNKFIDWSGYRISR